MATIANQYDPNNPNANQNTGGGGTVMPLSRTGGASSGTGSGPSAYTAATPYSPPNVSQYLAANQGAGQQLTQGITNNVQNQANQLNNQLNTSQNSLNSQYQNLNNNLNTPAATNIANSAFQNPQQLLDAYNAAKTQSSNQPLSSQQQTANDQYNQFQQLNNGGYNQAIQNYGNSNAQAQGQLQNQLANLTQQTGSANNEMGRNQLLQNAVGQGNYNQGEQTLDSLFLQGAPGQTNSQGLSNLQQLQQNLGNIGSSASTGVNNANTDAQAKLAALQGMSSSDQQYIKNLFTGGLNSIAGNVGNEYTAAQNAQTAYQSGLAKDIASGNLSSADYQQLGIAPGTQLWGVGSPTIGGGAGGLLSANGIVTNTALQGPGAAGNAQVATPQEFARYNALNQLAGGPNGLQSSIFGTATAANGYSPFNVNQQALNDQINAARSQVAGNQQGSEFYNALMGGGSSGGGVIPALVNYSAPGPGFGGMQAAPQAHPDWNSIGHQLQTGLQSGSLNPDQAQTMIQNFIKNNAAINGASGEAGLTATFQPFLDYYKNVYSPAATDIAGNPAPIVPGGPAQGPGAPQMIHQNPQMIG